MEVDSVLQHEKIGQKLSKYFSCEAKSLQVAA